MGLSREEVLEIEYAAALHDIGKIGVADSILRKVEPLDPDHGHLVVVVGPLVLA